MVHIVFKNKIYSFYACTLKMPIQAVGQSKAWVCGFSLAGIAGSNPAAGMDVCGS